MGWQLLQGGAVITSPSSSQSYDTLMTLKADPTIRRSDNLNNLIHSIINPLLNIHSRIMDSYHHHQSHPTRFNPLSSFAEMNPIDTINEGMDQLLSILTLLDNDLIRPTHKLSNSLKTLRRHLHLLQGNSKTSSPSIEPRSIRKLSKQSLNVVGTLMSKTRGLRRVIKEFIYWADSELMGSLASSKPILEPHQDPYQNSFRIHGERVNDEEFYEMIDRCVDLVQSAYQLNLFLKTLQDRFRKLSLTLGSLTFSFSNQSLLLNQKHPLSGFNVINHQSFDVMDEKTKTLLHSISRLSSFDLNSKSLSHSIDLKSLMTVHGLIKRLRSTLTQSS
ncbi:hypothetical protein DFH28DRAFT_1082245 [Melampsora americana]|nr:hypothetical protein DFH28DRAFT_1082245 [Melampsora americana]